jgi:hypothetical protein
MRTSFHHQPEAQHPNFQLSTSWQADYPIFTPESGHCSAPLACPLGAKSGLVHRNKATDGLFLFDYLVRAGLQGERHGEPDRPGGSEVDH